MMNIDIGTEFGSCCLERHSESSHVANLRIVIDAPYRREGRGTVLVKMALALAPVVGIRRIEATPYIDNPESKAFISSLRIFGFQCEGVKRGGGKRDGMLVDTELWSWVSWRT